MADYAYNAIDGKGDRVRGVISAATLEEAGRMLRDQDKFVIDITPEKDGKKSAAKPATNRARGKKVPRSEVIYFANQMAVMVSTGIPIVEALDGLVEHAANPKFRDILADVRDQVAGGKQFSDALAANPSFPPIMVALMRASEASGSMGAMLDRVSKYLTKEHQTLKSIRGALMYPLFMLVLCLSVTVFLLTVVLPRFSAIYTNKGAVLPGPTRILMTTSDSMVGHWPLWVGGAVGLVVGLVLWGKTKAGRQQLDWLKLNSPIFGNIFRKLYLSRATRTLSTMIDSGVLLLNAISIVKDVTPNSFYQKLWENADEAVCQGEQFSAMLYETDLIPDPIAQMIASGEKSGQLGKVLSRVADFTETEFDQAVKTGTQFIEPVMIVFMGSLIGFIAIALLLPIFSVGKVMSGS